MRPAKYNANGQPQQIGSREYVWDALGRLVEVREEDKSLASYTYNHRSERIGKTARGQSTSYLYEDGQVSAELNEQGQITRQYLYLAGQIIAVIDSPQGNPLSKEELSAHVLLGQDAQNILKHLWHSLAGSDGQEQTAWLHANHLGAPEAATDASGQLIWQASYAPFGAARIIKASAQAHGEGQGREAFTLNLRLPGQYFDAETGLFYNKQRYYDPARGEYLTPDPLGTPDGPNGYSYVRYNPLKYVDPDGLILFAFDGTNNSNPPPGVDDFSNVYKFFQGYDQAANGRAWYMNGVGRNDPDSGINRTPSDQYFAGTARARVNYMLDQFDNYALDTLKAKPNEKISIDIVGFSRGAAMARDFSNRLATWLGQNRYGVEQSKCVEIRFMGLWDTVAQFGADGLSNTDWQLTIPAQAKHVFQAVAINENRYLFPGESINRGTQRGFIGSHADIGGSYGTGDLSDVALNWITEQATLSGIKMKAWGDQSIGHAEWGIVTNPVVHDKSDGTENSAFCDRANNGRQTNCSSRRTANPGGLTAGMVTDNKFIVARAKSAMDADGSSKITGDVNMKEYAKWLKDNYQLDIAVGP